MRVGERKIGKLSEWDFGARLRRCDDWSVRSDKTFKDLRRGLTQRALQTIAPPVNPLIKLRLAHFGEARAEFKEVRDRNGVRTKVPLRAGSHVGTAGPRAYSSLPDAPRGFLFLF